MNNEVVIKELNAYLKGEYMAIHSYEQFIEQVTEPSVRTELQRIQQEHKEHAAKIAERIQDLGGRAVNDNGVRLSMMEGMMRLKGTPDTVDGILKNAIKGQEMGMQKTEEIVRGDLDPESKKMVAENLDEDREHINQLNNLIQ
ncbi:ferritin-like domain-containing protein [Oceanobacillus sp. Castelsardo]|uniref:ferritin-like domain-containing protein n=1 Tax=Oceanobacillus sp. Castelsardo TaxID=1851204 RepID=UPI000837D3DE|nr:ferritin-like domain-containing protein [Oceanobacillus sp. Castelsardo]